PNGKPLYPQRSELLGPKFAEQGAGSHQTGRFTGKMIVIETLVDEYASPWNADWYRMKVKEALGYLGALQQALRDVSAWVEKGVPPPSSTSYKVVGGQIEVPPKAAARKGIQPVVTLSANGGMRAEVAAGRPVEFSGLVEVPPNTGKVVGAEWDFEGTGDYPVAGQVNIADASGGRATVKTTYSFSKAGTYFPALRIASQREGDTK